jgi:hypothetical protein
MVDWKIMLNVKNNRAHEEKTVPLCEDDPCEFFRSEWGRVGPRWSSRLHCVHPDHPDYPRAHPDDKCPKLIEGVGRRLEVEEPSKESQRDKKDHGGA